MRIFTEAKGYANPENAEKKLRKELGENADRVRWFIVVNSAGRFCPCVAVSETNGNAAAYVHAGICVVG